LRANHSDALIIGGGHNGLVCAAYLAAGGLKVTVLERRAASLGLKLPKLTTTYPHHAI